MRRMLLVLALSCAAALAHAQVDRATLGGEVRDQTSAVVPNAAVVVTNTATNVSTRLTTNAEGVYLAVNLSPGRYRDVAAVRQRNHAQRVLQPLSGCDVSRAPR